jgi:hypothetical protein
VKGDRSRKFGEQIYNRTAVRNPKAKTILAGLPPMASYVI